jgi:hypothetical protein
MIRHMQDTETGHAITLEVGALQEALHQILPRRTNNPAKRKIFPITFKFHGPLALLAIFDAKHEMKRYEVPAHGSWPERIQLDGNKLRAVLDKLTSAQYLSVLALPERVVIQFDNAKLSLERLDAPGRKGIVAKPPRHPPHKGPVTIPPDPVCKRVALDDTWGFSARVPMPQHRKSKD